MAVKPKHRKSKRRTLRRTVRAVHGGLSRLRKQAIGSASDDPAPHSDNGAHSDAGILRPNSGYLRLPEALAEVGETEADDSSSQSGLSDWMPGRVVLVITALAIAFIAIIAWFVSRMPDAPSK